VVGSLPKPKNQTMLHNKKIYGFLAGFTMLLVVIGCYKDRTIVSETGAEITRTVSFSGDIITILNKSCNTSGCHNAGGTKPDLSPANAHKSLSNGYLNTGNPEASELYQWMIGKRGMPMPTEGINKDYNALVLAWLKQGAKNN
jgi:hypothetical protein